MIIHDDKDVKASAPVVRTELNRTESLQPRSRIPFGVPRAKLAVIGDIPGYELAFINDLGSRIDEARLGGYEFVGRGEIILAVGAGAGVTADNSDLGDRISMVVGTDKKTGTPYRAYLMKIKKEFKDENRAILGGMRKKRLGSIKRGQASAVDDKFYIPDGTPISISSKKS